MITRSKMRRQLYRGGGIASIRRQKYGLGDWVRKLIPNELADVAVKAAPFVAPFNPAVAAAMRGIGRYDQRGNLGDAFKQAALTYGGGQLARGIGGAPLQTGNPFTEGGAFTKEGFKSGFNFPLDKGRMGGVRETTGRIKDRITGGVENIFKGGTQPEGGTSGGITKGLSDFAKEQLLFGTVTGGLSYMYEKFFAEEKQLPGESYGEFLARRKKNVAQKMRAYKDNYLAFDADWNELSDEEKTEQINTELSDYDVQDANMNQGGRVGYQTGGITMANTLAENIRRNQAQAAANKGVLQAARSKLPGYVAPYSGYKELGPNPTEQEAKEQFQILENAAKTATPEQHLNMGLHLPPGQHSPFIPEGDGIGGMLPDFYEKVMPPLMPEQPAGTDRPYTAVMPREGYRYVYDPDGTRRQVPLTPEEKYRMENPDETATLMPVEEVDQIDMTKPPGTPIGMEDSPLTVMPQYNNPLPYDQLMAGFEQFKKDNPEVMQGFGTLAIKKAILPGGYEYDFSGSLEANAFRKYLESIGQAPYQGRREPGDLVKLPFEKLNQGGRVGLYAGGEPKEGIESLDAGAPNITYKGNEGPQAPQEEQQMAGMMDQISLAFEQQNGYDISLATPEVREIFIQQWMQENFYDKESRGPVLPSPEDPINPFAPKPTGPVLPDKMMAAKGGRIKYRMGTGPQGLPGIPRMAPDGMEFDMRQNGGFQGLGAKEGKDDVPAMLAKNEFVFTADAVRGAGGGDIELGAQRMYDTMKNLERRMA